MKILSLLEAKLRLSALVDRVSSNDEVVVITKNGRPAAVLVSPDELDSWRETIGIRGDRAFVGEIRKRLQGLKKKGAKLYTLDELFD